MEVSFGWPFAIGIGLGLCFLHRFKVLLYSLEFTFDIKVSFEWPFAIGIFIGLGLLHRFKVLSLGKIL